MLDLLSAICHNGFLTLSLSTLLSLTGEGLVTPHWSLDLLDVSSHRGVCSTLLALTWFFL